MKIHSRAVGGSALVAGAVGAAAVLGPLSGGQAMAVLPGAVSWWFFVRWCRRSFRPPGVDWQQGSLRH